MITDTPTIRHPNSGPAVGIDRARHEIAMAYARDTYAEQYEAGYTPLYCPTCNSTLTVFWKRPFPTAPQGLYRFICTACENSSMAPYATAMPATEDEIAQAAANLETIAKELIRDQ